MGDHVAHIGARWSAVMVGWEREQTMLRQQFTDTLRGHGRFVLVSGAAGIGKTTLIQSLADEAQERGALVLSGHCDDFGTTPPYGPWAEIASAYRDTGALLPFPAVSRDDRQLSAAGSEVTRQFVPCRPHPPHFSLALSNARASHVRALPRMIE